MEQETETTESGKKLETTLFVTYNRISGAHNPLESGVYELKNKRVIIFCPDKKFIPPEGFSIFGEGLASARMKDILDHDKVSGNYEIDSAFVYVGANAMDGALGMAYRLNDGKRKISIVSCRCDREQVNEKERIARQEGFNLIWSECRGESTLSELAARTLGLASWYDEKADAAVSANEERCKERAINGYTYYVLTRKGHYIETTEGAGYLHSYPREEIWKPIWLPPEEIVKYTKL